MQTRYEPLDEHYTEDLSSENTAGENTAGENRARRNPALSKLIGVLIAVLAILFLANLSNVGFLGPDEPRYASIGREMARSGDWITPRLDGKPWFEKPPLTYWLTALGHLSHLTDENAARLPQVLLSLAFLFFFYRTLAAEFSRRIATVAVSILATSVGWMAYSFVGLTDLPMSVTLAAAMLLALTKNWDRSYANWIAGGLLGLSFLAKGFVPMVLFAPVLLLLVIRGPKNPEQLPVALGFSSGLRLAAGALIVAAPWVVLCWLRNGQAFWDDFFWKQHIARFYSPTLEHVQPFWYYVPVLLAGLFPWTPLVALLANRKLFLDVRIRFLAGWVLYGFIFFSAARNKLPGYLLPLVPAIAVLLAIALEQSIGKGRRAAVCLVLSALLLILLPAAADVLPLALVTGIRRADLTFAPHSLIFAAIFVVIASAVGWLAAKQRFLNAIECLSLATTTVILYLMFTVLPVLDRNYSVRGFYREAPDAVSEACLDHVNRAWEYGLNYYAGHPLPQCGAGQVAKGRIIVKDRVKDRMQDRRLAFAAQK